MTKIHGLEEVLSRLKSIRGKLPDTALTVLRTGGERIKTTAQQYAPVDEHPLENSIKTQEQVMPGRAVVSIYVDENTPTNRNNVTVGDYALAMHEGDYNLGPLSRAKQAALGVEVGPKYLERALNDNKPAILRELKSAVRKTINTK